jgi:VanZ family protein
MSGLVRPKRDRFSWVFLSLALIWAGILAWLLLSQPGDLSLFRSPDYILNFGHALVFALLSGLLYLGLPKSHAFILLGFLLAGSYGALLEFLQTWVPGRIGDPIDAMTNVLGAAWGISSLSALGTLLSKPDSLPDSIPGSIPGSIAVLRLPLLLLLASLGSALIATFA